jgi:hypothetical protein
MGVRPKDRDVLVTTRLDRTPGEADVIAGLAPSASGT